MRRTDKITEAKYYALDEYLQATHEFFDSYNFEKRIKTGELDPVHQIVYLATDEKNVFVEAQKMWDFQGFWNSVSNFFNY